VRKICTLGSAWGDEFKKPSSLGEGTGAKVSDNAEAPQRATATRLVSTILRI
jgi:predicted phage gp36 major capsid-like protein